MTVITQIYRYPVKGLSPESVEQTEISAGEGVPGDRSFALARAESPFDPENPVHLKKTNFLVLLRDEKLARLITKFDPASQILSVAEKGVILVEGCLSEESGRGAIADFYQEFMDLPPDQKPRIAQAPGHMFSDLPDKVVSLINLASVRDLEEKTGWDLDPLRFRANVYFEGLEAWREFNWLDQEIRMGRSRLQVIKRTQRCAATNVNPASAERDTNVPKALMDHYGHMDLGIYARVTDGGSIRTGDEIFVVE